MKGISFSASRPKACSGLTLNHCSITDLAEDQNDYSPIVSCMGRFFLALILCKFTPVPSFSMRSLWQPLTLDVFPHTQDKRMDLRSLCDPHVTLPAARTRAQAVKHKPNWTLVGDTWPITLSPKLTLEKYIDKCVDLLVRTPATYLQTRRNGSDARTK